MARRHGEPLPIVCILAGGLGSRLGRIVADTPKPIVEVAGEPFINHQLRLLASFGITRVVLCVGYLGRMVESSIGYRWGPIRVQYSYDGPTLQGTLGALRNAKPLLDTRFLVLYGDTYLRLDYARFYREWVASDLPAGMAVLENNGRWDRSNAVYRDGRVTLYDKSHQTAEMKWIDYGLGGLTLQALEEVPASEGDLSSLYGELSRRGALFGMEAVERFYEIGTPSALRETDSFIRRVATKQSSQSWANGP